MQHNIPTENVNKASELMGKEPVMPIGACFLSALEAFGVLYDQTLLGRTQEVRLVHAIGVANMPGQEGETIAHAWIEFNAAASTERLAMDVIWAVVVPAKKIREDIKASYIIEYEREKIRDLMFKDGRFDTGPWDTKIIEIVEGVKI